MQPMVERESVRHEPLIRKHKGEVEPMETLISAIDSFSGASDLHNFFTALSNHPFDEAAFGRLTSKRSRFLEV